MEHALRQVVHDALTVAAEHGLPGRHHFYITFRTDHPGVVVGDGLRARYPSEMTIVLQHEYWGLEVGPDGFAVTLSFNGAAQRLVIPFAAVRVFADPSVEFGLQFTVAEGLADDQPADGPPKVLPATVAELPEAPAAPPDQAASESGSAEVVTLDRFRKKRHAAGPPALGH